MKIWDKINAVLAFRTIPTSVLLVLVYAAIFSTVLVTDELPNVPKNKQGLDLDKAYADLHVITARPHPYNSHTNDDVRSFILSRMSDIASSYPNVHISSDLTSNVSFASSSGFGTYFEGTNVLVKIDGSDETYSDRGGVLFSAHYDSVSTAPGTTDNGMGVVTLMQMVEYLAKHRKKRTAVFNFNNGEEDGLHGAHAFLLHPWSKIPDSFLNLEGAAAGGRPILFRATSISPLRSFLSKNVPHPHTNVLSADSFARGVVRSGTDYTVYNGPGSSLEGLDFAFYKGRSKYHTKDDSIPGADGGVKSLWAMMEAVRGAGVALVDDPSTHVKQNEIRGGAVYFDLFAATLVIFQLSTLFTINIVLLVVGPMVLILLAVVNHVVQFRNRQGLENGDGYGESASVWKSTWEGFKRMGWLKDVWRRAKFWLAFVVTMLLQVLLVFGYIKLNPFIVNSHEHLVIISTLTLAFITTIFVLKLPIIAGRALLPEQEKHTVLGQSYILTWFLLLGATIVLGKLKMGGVYFITAWNAVLLLGTALTYLEVLFGAKGTRGAYTAGGHSTRGLGFEEDETLEEHPGHIEGEGTLVESEPTETSPLMGHSRPYAQPHSTTEGEADSAIGWWILQLMIVVPLPVILVTHIAVLLLAALHQTLSDGSSPVIVYGAIALLSTFLILPLAPFSVKIGRVLMFILLVIFVVTTVYTWLAFPFSETAPLKVFFQQKLELDEGKVVRAVTALTGVPKYLDNLIVPELPSALWKDVHCAPESLKPGLSTCRWESGLLPSPGGGETKVSRFARSSDWLSFKTKSLGPTAARISIKGVNTRSCRIYFDTPITGYNISESGVTSLQTGYEIPDSGLSDLRLWSRTWDREFVVDVTWNQQNATGRKSGLTGKVACEWTEYRSGTAGGRGTGGEIPAFEEVLAFLPKWAIVSKATDGLVEAWNKFSV